ALARRKRLAEKFTNPMGRKTDAALFSGKRMDDGEEVVQYSASALRKIRARRDSCGLAASSSSYSSSSSSYSPSSTQVSSRRV
ncbi:hypothetical protein, partial [Klebsiella pneumoniae]|uniref:hypothetical protein n=1 Tax=Klebsiella pneumoniae TaxID=573 RepID=UPI00397068C0